MIYANDINVTITRYNTLPKDWNGEEGFQYSNKEKREANGFFELIIPKYDSETQKLGQIIGDVPLTHYTYEVIDRDETELLLENTAKRKEKRNQLLKAGVVVQNIWFDKSLLVEFLLKVQMYQAEGVTEIEWGLETGWATITIEEAYLAIKEAEAYFTSLYKDYA